MSVGEIQQIGTPSEIYDRPRNMFVAGFIGSPAMNFFNVHYQDQVIDDHKGVQLTIPEGMAKVLDNVVIMARISSSEFDRKIFILKRSSLIRGQIRQLKPQLTCLNY